MGLVERVKRTVVGEKEPEEYTYECRNCQEVFEREEVDASIVECPNCGNQNARQLPS